MQARTVVWRCPSALIRSQECFSCSTSLVYEADGLTMRSKLVFEPGSGRRPAVLVFPEAFGLDVRVLARAERLAALGYVTLACDLHGNGRVVGELQAKRGAEIVQSVQKDWQEPFSLLVRAYKNSELKH